MKYAKSVDKKGDNCHHLRTGDWEFQVQGTDFYDYHLLKPSLFPPGRFPRILSSSAITAGVSLGTHWNISLKYLKMSNECVYK